MEAGSMANMIHDGYLVSQHRYKPTGYIMWTKKPSHTTSWSKLARARLQQCST